MTEPEFWRLVEDDRINFGRSGSNNPALKIFLNETQGGLVPRTIWPHGEVGHSQEAKREVMALFSDGALFATPKPERLINRIIQIATNPGDLVLDSFLGSGTTAAVAHKMGRRYIGIEMGEHAHTHCAPRLQKVIDGEQGGTSEAVGWTGGGGFRFYRLGPPVFDEGGHIRQDIRFPVLAAHVWFSETDRPWDGSGDSPLLGIQDGRAHALLYNGILGDKRPGGGNVLTRATLALILEDIAKLAPDFDGRLTVYGEQSRLTPATLDRERITFKQTPYDVKARA
jgi:adenine-specific DNA-methyltransferase